MVDYVIVWASSRWARNTVDHPQAREVVRKAGARLISVTEPLIGDDTASGFLYESIVVAHTRTSRCRPGERQARHATEGQRGGHLRTSAAGIPKQRGSPV